MNQVSSIEKRLLAIVVDGVVLGAVSALLSHATLVDERGLILAIFSHLYFILFHWLTGSTLGKYAARIQVVDSSTGVGLSAGQALIRESPYVLFTVIDLVQGGGYDIGSSSVIWVSLGFFIPDVIAAVTDDRKRSLHDRLAKTMVVMRSK